MSDFPRSVALVSEGFCPLCRGPLVPLRLATSLIDEDAPTIDGEPNCDACDIRWTLDTSMGASQPMLRPSRSLTHDEIAKLFARPEADGG